MRERGFTKWLQRAVVLFVAGALLLQLPAGIWGQAGIVHADDVSSGNTSSASVDVGTSTSTAYWTLASYANNLLVINQLDGTNSKKIISILSNAKKVLDNWNSNSNGNLNTFVTYTEAQMDAVISSLPATTSDFLSLADTYQTPTVKYGDTVTISLPVINYANVPLSDVMVRPEISNLVAQWPFEPNTAGATCSIKSIPAYDSSKKMEDVRQDIGFQFKVRSDVMSGYYPLKFDFTYTRKGTVEKATLTTYVKTIGKDGSGSLDDSTAAGSKQISKPRIIVTGFETAPQIIKAGSKFTVTIHVKNTSETEAVNNVLFDLQAVVEGTDKTNTYAAFLPTSGSSSIYFDTIAPKSSKNLSMEMTARSDLSEKPYVLDVNMKYDCKDAADLTDTASVSVPIYQASRCESGDAELTPNSIAVGEQSDVTFSVYNTGKTTLNNVWVKFKGKSISGGDTYLGNISPGGTGNVDAMLTGAAPTADDGSITAYISFENATGEVTTVEKKLQLTVTEAEAETAAASGTDAGAVNNVKTGQIKGGPGIGVIAVIVAAAAIIVGILLVLKKKKKRKKENAALAADLQALDEIPQPLYKTPVDDPKDAPKDQK